MRTDAVKFNNKSQPEFFKDLRKRVDHYFDQNKITKYANTSMKFKTIF
ncbi:MAG TPA: acyl-CoA desaturase, partial [Saprospirales bacterium]|nr:acyl-CoA desaturase [Saprospirales bacterium]